MRKKIWLLLPLLFAMTSCKEATASSSFSYVPSNGDYRLMIASDLHYLSPQLHDNGASYLASMASGDGKLTKYCEEIVDALAKKASEEKPQALVLTGDLSWVGAKTSEEDLAKKLRQIQEGGVKVLVIPGNHDIDYPMAVKFEGNGYTQIPSATAKDFREIFREFGYSDAVMKDENSFSYLYQFSAHQYGLFLDVNSNGINVLPSSVLSFLEEAKAYVEEQQGTFFSFSHQNLALHSEAFPSYRMDQAASIAAALEGESFLGNFSGHLHIQHIAYAKGKPDIASGCLTTFPCQFGVLACGAHEANYHTEKLDMETYAKENQSQDDFLLRFNETAKEEWRNHFYQQGYGQGIAAYGDEESAEAMGETFAALNLAYFEGSPLDVSPYAEGIQLFKKANVGPYVTSTAEDLSKGNDYRQYTFTY